MKHSTVNSDTKMDYSIIHLFKIGQYYSYTVNGCFVIRLLKNGPLLLMVVLFLGWTRLDYITTVVLLLGSARMDYYC